MPTAECNPLLAAALAYAARGWRVVPLHSVVPAACSVPEVPPACSCGTVGCESQGKHPRLPAWQKVATADRDQVGGWWRKWPEANVGVALGAESGIVSIDVDTEAGVEHLKDLAGGRPEESLLFKTGKGWRFLYAIPAGLPCPPATHVVKLGGVEAVRFQADGGQCVMPPSLHPSGARYAWVEGRGPDDGALHEMPAWLVAEMCRPKQPVWSDTAAAGAFVEGGDFNAKGDWWRDVLQPAGYTEAGRVDDVQRYTRPGKRAGISVTVGHYRAKDGSPALYVFSGNCPGLEAGRCYDKFGAFARLHCGGDFTRAAEELKRRGFAAPKGADRGRAQSTASNGTGRHAVPAAPAAFGDPITLDDASPTLKPFPLHVLPAGLQDLCLSAAQSVSCPVDYAAAHALGVAAGAIGAAYDLQVKRGFPAPALLWVCAVAPPGSGKSPSCAPVLAPVFAEQGRRVRAGEDKKPAYVEDVTVEKLAAQLHDQPRGLLMAWDEMAGWLTSFNQYKSKGSGNDRTRYLSIWDGRSIKVDRVGPDKPPIFVRRPRLSVVGGIQPEVLDDLREGPADGLFDRVLFTFPADHGLTVETWAEVDEAAAERWAAAVGDLWNRTMKSEPDGDRPNVILLTDDGRPVWQGWTEDIATRAKNPDAPAYFRNVAAKCTGYAARLALVVHLIREAYGEGSGMGVDGDGMFRGVMLADYFLAHGDRVRRAAGRDERMVRARAIDRWMIAREERPDRGHTRFTRPDAWASLRRNSAFSCPEDLDEPLRLLSMHRRVRWVRGSEPGPGRPAGTGCYEINPALLRGAGEPDPDTQAEV